MKPQINIVVLVDVIGALSERTLRKGNLAMMDDGTNQSRGQGTPDLVTVCRPGQVVQWTILAVDVQTPVEIRSISFVGAPAVGAAVAGGPGAPDKRAPKLWSGVFPPCTAPGAEYRYRLELQMYDGPNSVLSIDSCALACLNA